MQAWRIVARNIKTRQRLEQQYLDGHRVVDYQQALINAQSFAEQISARSRETWVGEVEEYTVGHKPSLGDMPRFR